MINMLPVALSALCLLAVPLMSNAGEPLLIVAQPVGTLTER